ncbi:MAG: thioredoxin domain-containing protein [Myxococcales bacterium]|jgi:protein-disulfide isomerase|nr:thioredoxin domain-containing protein [Myxococcales bacterium]
MPRFAPRRLLPNTLLCALWLAALSTACTEPWPITSCPPVSDHFSPENAPRYGPADAAVSLTFFADFECPYTHAFWRELSRYLKEIAPLPTAEHLSVYLRHYPLTARHPRALPAAHAAQAAYRQGNEYFWTMVPFLMAPAERLRDEDILYYAEAARLDIARFSAEWRDEETATSVARDQALGQALGIPGTPAVYICGQYTAAAPKEIIGNLRYLLDKERPAIALSPGHAARPPMVSRSALDDIVTQTRNAP